jgi:general secretion pathway protein D
MPVIGRLFSSTRDNKIKTEIVLLITPRLMRTMQRADARTVEFAAGTEASSSGGPLGGVSAPPFPPQTPQFQPAPQAAPAYVPNVPVPTTGGTQVPFGGVQPGQ